MESLLTDLVLRLSRSIVSVEVITQPASIERAPAPLPVRRLVASGVVADDSGGILIAASTVLPHATYLINFENRTAPATLVGIDYVNDLALLAAVVPLGEPVSFSSTQVCAGQMVISLGNAFGLRASPSLGFCAGARPDGNLQFSIATNCGSHGSGVFDLSGRLLGILNGTAGREQGLSTAAPAAKLGGIAHLLRSNGDRKAGYLGLTSIDENLFLGERSANSSTLASARGTEPQFQRVILITAVEPMSPASMAGIRPGDIVSALNEAPLQSSTDLSAQIRMTRPGTPITLTIKRNQDERRLFTTVGCRSAIPDQQGTIRPNRADSVRLWMETIQQELNRMQQSLDEPN